MIPLSRIAENAASADVSDEHRADTVLGRAHHVVEHLAQLLAAAGQRSRDQAGRRCGHS
jgi:hypothetical protein